MERLFIIQSIPEGFVANLRHTVQGLLLAELCSRKPIIYWGERFLYRNANSPSNGLDSFFDTRFCNSLTSLALADTFLPMGWSRENIMHDRSVKYLHDDNRYRFKPLLIPSLMSSDADVLVYTHWNHMIEIQKYIPESSPYHGMSDILLARTIFNKYLCLKSDILHQAQSFVRSASSSGRLIGVHIRGSDKITEYPIVAPESYREVLNSLLHHNDMIFLATDSTQALQKFRSWYGDRLAYNDCERSSDMTGVHFMAADKEKSGRDFLIDAYILSRCDIHLGNTTSHVSFLVQSMFNDATTPFANFINISTLPSDSLYRFFFYSFSRWSRSILKNIVRYIGLLG